MTFRPTILLFRVQEDHGTPYEGEYWCDITGYSFATIQEADDAKHKLQLAREFTEQERYRVFCDPGDVARALQEAEEANQRHYRAGLTYNAAEERALEEGGSATTSPQE